MTNYKQYLKDLLEDIDDSSFLHTKDIPSIDLYMDQVTTFMDEHLVLLKRDEDQKILTKTMINNYSKAHLLPPSVKKKYTKNHMIMLAMIYYMKQVLSITDIQYMMEPLNHLVEDSNATHNLESFFDTMTKAQIDYTDKFSEQILDLADISEGLFEDHEHKEKLSIISTVYQLSMQAAAQKYMATALIDKYLQPEVEELKKEAKEKQKDPNKDAGKEISKDVIKDIERIAGGKTPVEP